jgi:glycerol uptake facilitator-like aquaporin
VSGQQHHNAWRDSILGELVATAFLLIAIVGSGIAAERLSGGNIAIALLANAIATGCALFVLIVIFGPVSGAHMNPVVTLSAAIIGDFSWKLAPLYIAAQVVGAIAGTWIAHLMFELPVLQLSGHVRTGSGQWIAEIVATLGLMLVIWGSAAYRTPLVAAAVAAYISGAYWFTASTSFANPAVTLARSVTDTFSGIRPWDAPGFILAQLAALALAVPLIRRFNRAAWGNIAAWREATPP